MRFRWFFLICYDPKSYFLWRLVRQLICTMFISNNHTSFHLRSKKNFLNHQKVSKHYAHDCSFFKFLYFFMNHQQDILAYTTYWWKYTWKKVLVGKFFVTNIFQFSKREILTSFKYIHFYLLRVNFLEFI